MRPATAPYNARDPPCTTHHVVANWHVCTSIAASPLPCALQVASCFVVHAKWLAAWCNAAVVAGHSTMQSIFGWPAAGGSPEQAADQIAGASLTLWPSGSFEILSPGCRTKSLGNKKYSSTRAVARVCAGSAGARTKRRWLAENQRGPCGQAFGRERAAGWKPTVLNATGPKPFDTVYYDTVKSRTTASLIETLVL